MAAVEHEIGRAVAEELGPLRKRVLREGRDEPPAAHPADDDPATVHLAARSASGEVVGCVTLVQDPRRVGGVDAAIHLVLMAVAPEAQGSGVGGALLDAAIAEFDRRGESIWAAARTSALGFYEGRGFVADGDEFVGAMHLPHVLVARRAG